MKKIVKEYSVFTECPRQRTPEDRKQSNPDCPKIEERTNCPRQRFPGDRQQSSPDVSTKDIDSKKKSENK